MNPPPRKSVGDWQGQRIEPGHYGDVTLAVSESYSSMTVEIPIQVRRAEEEGPAVFVTAALHGDEINGTGAIRQLIKDEEFRLLKGSVVLVPVLNILAFDRHSRYLPDRRDLNRSFPGSTTGTLAHRMARTIFEEIVCRCDYGIDLHTAAVRRTNFPNVRADLDNAEVRRIATATGTEVVISGAGPKGALRRAACAHGCPTIVMEGGEVWKVEPGIVEAKIRAVKNVLRHLEMLEGPAESPDYQVLVERSKWVRADRGGFLQFHVKAGDVVEKGQPLATNTTLLGAEHGLIRAPFSGIVIGMTTLPAVNPGEPVCHLGKLPRGLKPDRLRRLRQKSDGLEERLTEELASNVLVVEPNLPED